MKRGETFRSLWERALRSLGYRRVPQVSFEVLPAIQEAVQDLARKERCPVNQMTTKLIEQALAQRRAAEIHLVRWKQLTTREQQVAALICLDYTNQQIAARLSISPDTVKSHVRNVLAKFELHRKSDLRITLSSWDFSGWDH